MEGQAGEDLVGRGCGRPARGARSRVLGRGGGRVGGARRGEGVEEGDGGGEVVEGAGWAAGVVCCGGRRRDEAAFDVALHDDGEGAEGGVAQLVGGRLVGSVRGHEWLGDGAVVELARVAGFALRDGFGGELCGLR